jgi:hypothetical protein
MRKISGVVVTLNGSNLNKIVNKLLIKILPVTNLNSDSASTSAKVSFDILLKQLVCCFFPISSVF